MQLFFLFYLGVPAFSSPKNHNPEIMNYIRGKLGNEDMKIAEKAV